MKKDYYLVLKVPSQASADQIRSAYRQRALELHPDVAGTGSEPFLEVQEAYGVLADPERRRAYDHAWRPAAARPSDFPRRPAEPLRESPRPPLRTASLERSFDTHAPSLEELFDRLWANFVPASRPKGEHIQELSVEIPVTPEQSLRGGAIRLLVPCRVSCPTCQGRGVVGSYHCWRCGGQGAWVAEQPVLVRYPACGRDYVVQVPLQDAGIENFYLTVRFRVAGGG